MNKLKIKFNFKSVFTRLFVTYLSILILSFVMIAVVLSKALESHFMKQKQNLMITHGERMVRQFASPYYEGEVKISMFFSNVQILSNYIDARIWLIDDIGQIIVDSSDVLKGGDVVELIPEIQELFYNKSKESMIIQNKFNDIFNQPTLTVVCPVITIDDIIKGALIIHSPMLEIKQSIKDTYTVFLFCLLISAFVAFILIYYTSKRITKPLKDINDAARVISNGDFNKRIEIVSNDEIGQLGKSFNDMAEGLNRLEEYRRRFIANISHDLRSPITSIQGFLNAILDGTIPEEKQEKYLKIVLDETNRLTKLTNDILELTKFENHEIELNKENFDLNEMIRNILLSFETRMVDKNVKVKVLLAKENTWVYADAQKIQRVIYNLLDNAVKFTNENGSITIETTYEDSKVNVSISDTGIGIKEEDLKHIFERFYKVDSSRGQDKKGTGLGLAIVKEIIKAHNQKITVESELKKGTKFTFSLDILNETI